jgi:hypothetical protein
MGHLEHCPLCDQQEDSINHLLASCVSGRQFWDVLLRTANQLVPQPNDVAFEDRRWLSSQWVVGQVRERLQLL